MYNMNRYIAVVLVTKVCFESAFDKGYYLFILSGKDFGMT